MHPLLLLTPSITIPLRRMKPRLRARHPLIRIGRLFPHFAIPPIPLNTIAPPGTAARAEQPEEARDPGEEDCEPCPDIDCAAHAPVDVVLFEGVVEYPCEGRVEDCGCEGEGDGEEGGDG